MGKLWLYNRTSKSTGITLLLFIILSAVAQSTNAPLPVSVAVGAKQFPITASLALSPDSRFVAYALQDGRRITEPFFGTINVYTKSGVPIFSQGCDIWLTNLQTRHTVNLTEGFGSSWSPVWSGNGRYLAFLSDRGGAVHLWVWDRISGQSRQVSSAIVHDIGLQGKIHWVTGDRKVLAPLVPQGMSAADADAYAHGYLVMRDGRKVLSHGSIRVYTNDPKSPNNAASLALLQGYEGSENGDFCDYGLIDILSGKVKRILLDTSASIGISNDQRYAVTMRESGAAEDNPDQGLYDVTAIALDDGKPLFSIRNIPMVGTLPSWQPGKDAFVYTTGARSLSLATKQHGAIGQSYLVSVPDGRSRQITTGEHPTFGLSHSSIGWNTVGNRLYYLVQGYLWVANPTTGIVRPLTTKLSSQVQAFVLTDGDRVLQRGSSIYVLTRNAQTKQESLAAIDAATGAISKQFITSQNLGGGAVKTDPLIAALQDGTSIIYVAEDARHPWDLWSIDTSLTKASQLTHFNPELERYRYGKARIITWSTPDGQSYQGALLLPSSYVPGHRYPTIIYQYPGDKKSNDLNIFGGEGAIWGNFQLYATRGYAVFMPDMLWKPFADADLTDGRALLWVNAMLDKLVALGVSDPHRFGIEGLSNGGYSTLAFITQTHRFSAAIDDSGLASRLTAYTEFSRNGNAFYVGQEEQVQSGTPWTSLSTYIAQSPFYKFDQVTTPLMIVQGSGAIWVQQKEADETYVALRRLDKEVTYVIYQGDGHSRWSWVYPHEIDYWNRAIDWYDRHLKL